MSPKKRKADALENESLAKKAAKSPSPSVKVTYHEGPEVARPVVALAPGVSLPSTLKFQSFARKRVGGRSELLLHSSTHPTIDFTAIENDTYSDKHLKHYVAVFDPASRQLNVTPARRMTARSVVRQRRPADKEDEQEAAENIPVTNYSSRAALTNTFGTKKSKKAVQSMAENRLLARGGDDVNNPLSKAILSSMAEADSSEEPDTKELAQSNKPLPRPDMATDDIHEVYPLTSLIFPSPPSRTLQEMPIAAWVDAISKGKPIMTRSRYIANRSAYLTHAHLKSPSDETLVLHLRLLRYTLLLIEIEAYVRSLSSYSGIPHPSQWPAKTVSGNLPHDLLNGLVLRFFGDPATPNRQSVTLLQTTILALTLQIPPPSLNAGANALITEPTDIQVDLALEPSQVRKYYAELGCKFASATDAELALWGLEKMARRKTTAESGGEMVLPKPRFARLTFPIVFPTLSRGRPAQRRR